MPVLEGSRYIGLLVAHRNGHPYTEEDLQAVMTALRTESRERLPRLSAQLVPEVRDS
jgi:hypothetical protein